METKILTEDDIREYREIFPGWIAENLIRSTFTFLVATEENNTAGLCFVTQGMLDQSREKTAITLYFKAEDKKTADALLSEYEKTLKKMGIKKSIVSLARDTELSEADQESLKKRGYEVALKETDVFTVTTEEILSMEQLKETDPPKNIGALKDYSGRMIRKGLRNCLSHDERKHFEDLEELPFEWYDPEVSCCMEVSGKLVGFFLIHKSADGRFRAEVLTSTKEAGKNGLLQLLQFSASRLCSLYPKEATVLLVGRDDPTKKLIGYFFPAHRKDAVWYAEKKG